LKVLLRNALESTKRIIAVHSQKLMVFGLVVQNPDTPDPVLTLDAGSQVFGGIVEQIETLNFALVVPGIEEFIFTHILAESNRALPKSRVNKVVIRSSKTS